MSKREVVGYAITYESVSDETTEWVTSGELDGEPCRLTAKEEES